MCSKISFTTLLLAVICGAALSAAPEPAAVNTDACALLTQAQVTDALGVSVGAGAHVTPQYVQTCTWTPTGNATKGVKAVTLHLEPGDSYESGKAMMASIKSATVTSASGIGDDAYYLTTGHIISLIFKKGKTAGKVVIYGGDFPADKVMAIEKALVTQALSKL